MQGRRGRPCTLADVTIQESLQRELTEAIRRRDTSVVAVLRSALSALANAQAAPTSNDANTATGSRHFAGAVSGLGAAEVERLTQGEEQQRTIIADEVAELSAHVGRLDSLCRRDEADAARRALQILTGVLGTCD